MQLSPCRPRIACARHVPGEGILSLTGRQEGIETTKHRDPQNLSILNPRAAVGSSRDSSVVLALSAAPENSSGDLMHPQQRHKGNQTTDKLDGSSKHKIDFGS